MQQSVVCALILEIPKIVRKLHAIVSQIPNERHVRDVVNSGYPQVFVAFLFVGFPPKEFDCIGRSLGLFESNRSSFNLFHFPCKLLFLLFHLSWINGQVWVEIEFRAWFRRRDFHNISPVVIDVCILFPIVIPGFGFPVVFKFTVFAIHVVVFVVLFNRTITLFVVPHCLLQFFVQPIVGYLKGFVFRQCRLGYFDLFHGWHVASSKGWHLQPIRFRVDHSGPTFELGKRRHWRRSAGKPGTGGTSFGSQGRG
mmetsp:Transcript_26869/g.58977  ORF Transcript_26869/g.58977 Transcript_26869/m.58977 type:complete len:253 (+) Transcript_26869:1200-1958(+)